MTDEMGSGVESRNAAIDTEIYAAARECVSKS